MDATEDIDYFVKREDAWRALDLLMMKAVADGQDTQTYWHDALGILGRGDLDWDYLLSRATQHGARRIQSLLIYGESNDLVVPARVIQKLVKVIYGG